MRAAATPLKRLVPLPARAYLRRREHELRCRRALRRGLRNLAERPRGSDEIWQDLIDGWDNKRWSASPEYLDAVAAAALAEEGPILECGSGLSTLVLATTARGTGSEIWTLEHRLPSFRRIEACLHRFRLRANVLWTPLRAFEEFDWYDVDPARVPIVALVVCDGPPQATRGGRVGLVPVLQDRLAPNACILLDDAARPNEREVLARWASDAPLRYEFRGEARQFAVVRLA